MFITLTGGRIHLTTKDGETENYRSQDGKGDTCGKIREIQNLTSPFEHLELLMCFTKYGTFQT